MTTKIVRNNKIAKDLSAKDNILTQIDTLEEDLGIDMAQKMARLFPVVEDSCRLTMICHKSDYAASIVARAVEDCDAHVLNLNVSGETTPTGQMVVELRVGVNNGESVARSLARYGYEVVQIVHENAVDEDTMRRRVDELMHYIEL